MNTPTELIRVAESVADVASANGDDLLVIGAAALAGHNYVRMTRDFDLGGVLSLRKLQKLADYFADRGYAVELRRPDMDDPLGGVLAIYGDFGQIEVISFADRFPAVVTDAIAEATLRVREDSPLRIIPLPHLVVLKLYAGGLKSQADIIELLIRNPDTDLASIERLCEKYRISGFQAIRQELGR